MKKEVIHYILNAQTTPWEEGTAILKRLNPSHVLITRPDTPTNRVELLKTLGHHLRTNQLQEVAPVSDTTSFRFEKRSGAIPESPSPTTAEPNTKYQIPNTAEHSEGLSTEARLNLDINRMILEVRYFSRKLQAGRSDYERMKLYAEANKINDAIEHNKSLLRQLNRGNKINYVNTYFEAEGEDDFEVPDSILQIDKKYRYMMARRSKRLARSQEMEARHGTDSPQHQEVLAEWKHYDEVVKFLKSKIDESTKAAN
jgi:hypothetical protein